MHALKFDRHYFEKVPLFFPVVILPFFFFSVVVILKRLPIFKAEIQNLNIILSGKKHYLLINSQTVCEVVINDSTTIW